MFEKQKQDQEVGENAIAVQAGGDVTVIAGASYLELRTIFLDLFKLNFPKIQQVAKETADQRIEDMLDKLQKSFIKNHEKIDTKKFEDPAMQYEMQAIAIDVARKGEKSNVDLLCDLFCTMISKDCPELIELVSLEARKILPNLSYKHINYLSFKVLVDEAESTVTDIQAINSDIGEIFSYISNCSEITQNDIQYILVSGAIVDRTITHINVIPSVIKKIPELKDKSIKQILEYCNINGLNNLSEMQELSHKLNVGAFKLTLVGRLIGWLNLSKFIEVDIKNLFK